MSARQFVFSLLFKGDAAGAKAAGAEAKAAVEAVSAETKAAIPATEQDTSAQKKNAQARREAAAAAREQAEAEKRAREEAQRGIGGSGAPTPGPTPAPAPTLPQSELDKLKAQYVPLFAAQKAYEDELIGIAKAERAGALTSAESAAAQTRLRANYDRTTESLRRADAALGASNGKMKLQAHEARILSMQASDTFQSLALGMSPMQVLLQQGPQVVDILGGVGNTMRFLRQSLTGMRLLLGGTTAAVVAGALAWDGYLKSTKAVEIAAAGRGQGLGVSAGMLERVAVGGADAAHLSIGDSRSLLAQLVSSGQIGAQNLEGILAASSDLAVTLGIEADAVGGKLVEMFARPGQAAEMLRDKNGILSGAVVEQIKQLEAQNRKYEAQALLLDALEGKLVDAQTAQSALGRGWSAITRGIGNASDSFGAAINDAFETGAGAQPGGLTPIGLSKTAWDVVWYRQDKARAQTDDDARAEAGRAQIEANRKGAFAEQLADKSAANTITLKTEALRNEIAAMREGLAANDLAIEKRRRIEAAIQGQTAALAALTDRQGRANTMARLDLQIATERNPLRRAEMLSLQAFLQASAQGASAEDALAEGTRARTAAMVELVAGTSNAAAAMVEEADARDRLHALQAIGAVSTADAATWMERELSLRPLIAAAARAEGKEKADLEAEIRKLEDAYDDLAVARRQEALDADSRASAERIAQLQLEASLIGRSNDDRTRALALAEAERRVRDLGLDPVEADANRLRDEARAEAEAQIARDRQQRAFDLRTQETQDAYSAAARLAANPMVRAGIEAEAAYAQAIAQGADATEAAARAAQVRARAIAELQGSIADLVRTQGEQLDRLRLEGQLAGATDIARVRAIASFEAEQEIKRMGLSLDSQIAAQLREQAVLIAEQQRATEQLTDAWGKVRGAAETAIDAPFDALLNGDLKGAALAAVREIGEVWTELAWKNPLKNRLLGTDYTTLDDLGGLGGVFGQLFGGGEVNSRLSVSAMNAASMAVTTPMVTVNAGGITGLPAISGGAGYAAASALGAGGASGVLPGAGGIQAQMWGFFQGKGLAPHQIAAILGHASVESAFDPYAVGDGGTSFGLFQHHAGRGQGLLGAVGGEAGLGNIQAQLEYVWRELLTSENGAFQRLKSSTNLYDATHAFSGFERMAGYDAGNPQSAMHWDRRLAGAEAALAKFEGTSITAQAQLGTLGTGAAQLGTGMQQMTAGLAGTLQQIGASHGPGGAFLGALAGEGLKLLGGAFGFERGGWTGAGATTDVAGVVHAEEYVFDAAATRRIGVANLEALRRGALKGYREGGYVVGGRPPLPPGPARGDRATAEPARETSMNLNVSGTGTAEIYQGVHLAIRESLEQYTRNSLPGIVRVIIEDRWGG